MKKIRKVFSRHLMGIAIGGGIGALARLVVFSLVPEALVNVLFCNIIGSFIYAVATEVSDRIHPDFKTFITTGFCGGLSIFATFSKDSVRALQDGASHIFFINVFANFTLCIAAVLSAEIIVKKFRLAANKFIEERSE